MTSCGAHGSWAIPSSASDGGPGGLDAAAMIAQASARAASDGGQAATAPHHHRLLRPRAVPGAATRLTMAAHKTAACEFPLKARARAIPSQSRAAGGYGQRRVDSPVYRGGDSILVNRLGELERAIMDVLWESRDPLTVRQVSGALTERDLAHTTVMTVLDRLAKKGFARRERDGRAWRYRAAETREAYVTELSERPRADRRPAGGPGPVRPQRVGHRGGGAAPGPGGALRSRGRPGPGPPGRAGAGAVREATGE